MKQRICPWLKAILLITLICLSFANPGPVFGAGGSLGIGFSITDSTNYMPKSYQLLLQGDANVTVTIRCNRIGELETGITDKFGNPWGQSAMEDGKIVIRVIAAGVGTLYVNVRGKYDMEYQYSIMATQIPAKSPQDDEFAKSLPPITVNSQTGGHLGYRYFDQNYTDTRDTYQFKIPAAGEIRIQTAAENTTLSYMVELRNPNGDLFKEAASVSGKADLVFTFSKDDIGSMYSIHLVQRDGYGTYGVLLSYTASQTPAVSPVPAAPDSGSVANLALNRPTRQSSVYTGTGVDQSAHLAVDGKTAGRDPHDLIMTTLQNNPWWMVDLERVASIQRVRLYNRTNPDVNTCLTIEALLSIDGVNWQKIYSHNNTPWRILDIPAGDRQARFVKVQLPGYGGIALYEVEVLGR